MRSTIFAVLFLGLFSKQGAVLAAHSGPNQQAQKIAHIKAFTLELGEFLRGLSVKTTAWQQFFGREKWILLGPDQRHGQNCQVNSWTYKKNKAKGVHTLRGTIRSFAFTHELEVDENGSPEFSAEVCVNEKNNQVLFTLSSEQVKNELKKIIGWYDHQNPNDLHDEEINALNKLKGTFRTFLSASKKEFRNEPLIEHDVIKSFLALKLPKKINTKQLIALAVAVGAVATCTIIAIRKLRNSSK